MTRTSDTFKHLVQSYLIAVVTIQSINSDHSNTVGVGKVLRRGPTNHDPATLPLLGCEEEFNEPHHPATLPPPAPL